MGNSSAAGNCVICASGDNPSMLYRSGASPHFARCAFTSLYIGHATRERSRAPRWFRRRPSGPAAVAPSEDERRDRGVAMQRRETGDRDEWESQRLGHAAGHVGLVDQHRLHACSLHRAAGPSRRTMREWFFTRSTVKRNVLSPLSVLSFRSSSASVPNG